MLRRTPVWPTVVAVTLAGSLALPAAAVTVDDLDLSGLPAETKVLQIAQDENQQPLKLCAHWREKQWTVIVGPGAQKWIWIKVQLKPDSRYEHDWVWIKIPVPPPPPPNLPPVEVLECIKKCPEGASGTKCVENEKWPCPVCE